MKKRIACIHYQPVEVYPPALNVLNALANSFRDDEIRLYTTALGIDLDPYEFPVGGMKIHRTPHMRPTDPAPLRLLRYFQFYIGNLLRLIFFRPDIVIYYETISAFPAIVYKRFFNRKTRLFIHYHEYTTIEEYNTGMKLVNRFHQMEFKTYPKAEWLSHTNAERMQKFKADYPAIQWPPSHIFPNYPPRSWQDAGQALAPEQDEPVRFVYVGALSNTTMFCEEFCEWIIQQNGKATLDLYAHNIDPSARAYLDSISTEYIREKKGINYTDLPSVLSKYHIGAILYKGHNANFTFNAPNKLFEYLACGLDVWFPKEMQGCHAYQTEDSWPQVIRMDFENTTNWNLHSLVRKKVMAYRGSVYFCEDAIAPLVKQLRKNGD